MYDYHKLSTTALKSLLVYKANRYNKIMAGKIRPRTHDETDKILEQIPLISAVIMARENTLKLEGF